MATVVRMVPFAFFLATAPGWAQELTAFTVSMKDGRLSPAQLEVPAGRKIKIIVRNEGRGPAEFESLELRVEKVLSPGATSFVVVPPLKPGRYRFVDEFHPDGAPLTLIAK